MIGTFGAVSVAAMGSDKPGGQRPLPPPGPDVLAAQECINTFFRRAVAQRLGPCWRDLEGRGTVTIEHEYIRREGGDWVPHDLRVVHTSLPGEQHDMAEKCMRQAVESVVLPYNAGDGAERELLLVWTWAVPLPDPL